MDPRKTLLVALCVPALAFGLVACGGDDSDSNSDSGASSTAVESTTGMDTADSGTTATGSEDIVALAQGNKDLSTLVKALGAADLVSTLQGEGPYTVFAPTNEAFAALPPAELNRLLKPANKAELANILTYHVANGDVKSSDLKSGQMIKTLQGDDLKVTITGGGQVKIGDATVVTPDVEASNGTVHVIDTVLIPSN